MPNRPVIDTPATVRSPSPDLGTKNATALETAWREAQSAGDVRYACLSFACPAWEPLTWLDGFTALPRAYWHGRWSAVEYGAVGSVPVDASADTLSSFDQIARAQDTLRRIALPEGLEDQCVPRAFLAASFDPYSASDTVWEDVPKAVLVLPEAALVFDRERQISRLQLILRITPAETLSTLWERAADRQARYATCKAAAPDDLPRGAIQRAAGDRETWHRMIAAGLQRIDAGELRKIVLSRRICWTAEAPISPWRLLRRMRDRAHGAYHFAVQPSGRATFVGASPERLFRLSGGQIETECVAGTVARGAYDGEDAVLSQSLMASTKDRLEHNFVIEDVLESLRELCRHADVGTEPWILRLPTVQHLVTTARGELRDGVTVSDVLRRLHPTPAVGGTPRAAAMQAIRAIEGCSRGWYAGPVGWVSAHEAEFAVAIRSALVTGAEAHIFVGAGIVPGSTAAREWDETDAKAQSMLRILQP